MSGALAGELARNDRSTWTYPTSGAHWYLLGLDTTSVEAVLVDLHCAPNRLPVARIEAKRLQCYEYVRDSVVVWRTLGAVLLLCYSVWTTRRCRTWGQLATLRSKNARTVPMNVTSDEANWPGEPAVRMRGPISEVWLVVRVQFSLLTPGKVDMERRGVRDHLASTATLSDCFYPRAVDASRS